MKNSKTHNLAIRWGLYSSENPTSPVDRCVESIKECVSRGDFVGSTQWAFIGIIAADANGVSFQYAREKIQEIIGNSRVVPDEITRFRGMAGMLANCYEEYDAPDDAVFKERANVADAIGFVDTLAYVCSAIYTIGTMVTGDDSVSQHIIANEMQKVLDGALSKVYSGRYGDIDLENILKTVSENKETDGIDHACRCLAVVYYLANVIGVPCNASVAAQKYSGMLALVAKGRLTEDSVDEEPQEEDDESLGFLDITDLKFLVDLMRKLDDKES
jgi:hypothetical protein